MGRWRLVIGGGFAALILALAGPWVSGAPSGALAASCPRQPLTVAELRGLWDGEWAGFSVMSSPGGRACFGRAELTIIGFVNEPEGVGGVNAITLEPQSLTESSLILHGGARDDDGYLADGFYGLSSPPRLGNLQRRYGHRWVAVTAHFDDRRARRCRWEGPEGAELPSREEAVATCRGILVVSSIRTIAAPDSATASIAPGSRGGMPLETFGALAAAAALGILAWARRGRLPARERNRRRPGR